MGVDMGTAGAAFVAPILWLVLHGAPIKLANAV